MSPSERYKNRKLAYDATERCRACGTCPRVTKTLCERCRALMIRNNKTARERRRAAGLCLDCGRDTQGPTQRCPPCRDRAASSNRRWYLGRKTKEVDPTSGTVSGNESSVGL